MEHTKQDLAGMASRLGAIVDGYNLWLVGDVFQLSPDDVRQVLDLIDHLYRTIDARPAGPPPLPPMFTQNSDGTWRCDNLTRRQVIALAAGIDVSVQIAAQAALRTHDDNAANRWNDTVTDLSRRT